VPPNNALEPTAREPGKMAALRLSAIVGPRKASMQRNRALVALLLAVVIAMGGSACSLKMGRVNRALSRCENALRLELATTGDSPVADAGLGLRITLRNVSRTETIDACIGYSREYRLMAIPIVSPDTRKPLDEHIQLVDHPYCRGRWRWLRNDARPNTALPRRRLARA
jgi:hypothetical protein